MVQRAAPRSPSPPAWLGLGFRPFFLAAGALAPLAMLGWLAVLYGLLPVPAYYGPLAWHAHVMLFGYTAAVVAGFLLTAVRNWTGLATPTGWPLAGLVAVWLLGQLAAFVPVPKWLVAGLDLAFLPLLASALGRPLWQGAGGANRVFLALLAGMTAASLMVHLDRLGLVPGLASAGHRLMLDLTMLTLLVIAGRVMPFFTTRAIAGAGARNLPAIERLTVGLASLLVLANLLLPRSPWTAAVALSLAAVQLGRLWGWHDRRVWRLPILWVLYVGYGWLIVGLGLNGLAALGLVPPTAVLHALTVGAVGVFTLGMMARVALGHTGREMRAAGPTVLAFVLVNLAALVRVTAPLLDPAGAAGWLAISGGLWTAAFVAFLWVYVPILMAPRVDGQPG